MARVTGEVTIGRPVEDVFDVVADARNEPRYHPLLRRVDQVSPGPIGVGTIFAALHRGRRFPFELTITVTEYERPHRLGWARSMPAGKVRGTLTFEPVAEGTRLRWDLDLHPHGSTRLLGPFAAAAARQEERTCWEGLKRYLEDGAPTGSTPDTRALSSLSGSDATRGASARFGG